MSETDLLRSSRDGDQFHYLRGARLSLALLKPGAALVAVTVEGTSDADDIKAGDDVIDLALYEGSRDIADAALVRYRQFKHSTYHPGKAITTSGLVKTLKGFAQRYQTLVARFGAAEVATRFRFEFETNRPIDAKVVAALADINDPKSSAAKYLRGKIGIPAADLPGFLALFRLYPETAPFLEQRGFLEKDMRTYLPDNDRDAPMRLKELVTRKATSEFAKNPMITRHDVLEAIGATADDLYPAKLLIETPADLVARGQVAALAAVIAAADGPRIVSADAGVGKSVTAMQLHAAMPAGSRTFVYDCFGNGGYRSASEYRHRAREGLVQLANEMSAKELCDPLIPTTRADDGGYVRAFMARMQQADAAIAANDGALVLILIDAADNAEMASEEANDGPSFARLLLRENWPARVRLVLTARPHRVPLLNPPPAAREIELLSFSQAETAEKLRRHYPDATDQDVSEFHRLTSHNPRVQSTALAAGNTLAKVLAALGPTPRSVDDTIGDLLERTVARVRDAAVGAEQAQLDRVCTALATLRPFVPLDVVAASAEVPVALVRSIALDLQHPLLVREDAVQFRDEPTETWFRERFRPSTEEMARFVARLVPLAATSAYVAAVLPQLMLEAGQFDQLVLLALSGGALPTTSEIARRDVELQRLQFAIKAALRARRYPEAAKLALKAGGEAAADERQQALISDNVDLAARFLEPSQLVEMVARRQIRKGGWTGSDHAYEAGLLSGVPALAGDALSRLRTAHDWLDHLSRQRRTGSQSTGQLEPDDIAALILAELNLNGPDAAARQLRRWIRRETSYTVGRLLVDRLIDAGRLAEIDALALAAANDIGLLLAITRQLDAIGRLPPKQAVWRAARIACSRHVTLRPLGKFSDEDELVAALSALGVAAARYKVIARPRLAAMLGKYLPQQPPYSLGGDTARYRDTRATLMRCYALRAALRRRELKVAQLADKRTKKQLKRSHDPDADRFREDVGSLLPWHQLLAAIELGRLDLASLPAAITEAKARSDGARRAYREEQGTEGEIATLWSKLLVLGQADAAQWDAFEAWRNKLRTPLWTSTSASIARSLAVAGETARALTWARDAFDRAAEAREDAENIVSFCITIARAVLPANEDEAAHYFNQAILIASRVGNENVSRWEALLELAVAAASDERDDPQLAYRLARAGELTYHFVARDKYFDWDASVEAIVRLSPRSSFAIASRWADRRFGRADEILPEIVGELRRSGHLDPVAALVLLPLDALWPLDKMLDAALASTSDADARQRIAHCFWTYARFRFPDAKSWRAIQDSLERHDVTGIDICPALADAERFEERLSRNSYDRAPSSGRGGAIEGSRIFSELDLAQPGDIAEAWRRYKEAESGLYPARFFAAAMARVEAGGESAFLGALGNALPLSIHQLGNILDALPAGWHKRIAVGPALQALVRGVYRGQAHSVSTHRHVHARFLAQAASATGLTVAALVAECVDAIGQTTVPTDADDLFRLVGLLGALLSADEAQDALAFGLDLVEPGLEAKDGDGPWVPALTPPDEIQASLAGYLWGDLAAPEAARRWRAAHAVRVAAALGRVDILNELSRCAARESGGPFADAALFPYRWHGRQWLAIALARAAKESGAAVTTQQDWLKTETAPESRHVLVRGFAARALLELEAQGLVTLDNGEKARLATINHSPFPVRLPLKAKRHARPVRKRRIDGGFYFDIDFPKYVLSPLGRPFGLVEGEMEELAERIIRDQWGFQESGGGTSDARAMRGFFRDEWRRHRGDNRVDDLRAYLSHHAAMVLAGALLAGWPLRQKPDEDWYTFSRWLDDQGLSRRDGRWVADQRDLTPSDAATLEAIEDEAGWPDSLTDPAVEALVRPLPDRLIVSGQWTIHDGGRAQKVSIHSALVDPKRGRALTRSLQASPDHHAYRLPDLDEDDHELAAGAFVLKGWLRDLDQESGIDRHDPWRGGASLRRLFPGPVGPATALVPAPDGRSWSDCDGEEQCWLENWSDAADEDDDKKDRGLRLAARRSFLDRLMQDTGLSLIVEAEAQREYTGQQRAGRSSYDPEQRRTRLLLFEPGHEPISYRSPPRPRRKNRRRARARRA